MQLKTCRKLKMTRWGRKRERGAGGEDLLGQGRRQREALEAELWVHELEGEENMQEEW